MISVSHKAVKNQSKKPKTLEEAEKKMKLNKIKIGIATLTAFATIFGYSIFARAETKPIELESAGIEVEMTSRRGSESDINSIKETLNINLKKNDKKINIQGSHTDHTGEIEGKKAKGNENSIRVEVGKKLNSDLYLAGYTEVKDDVDPLREFGEKGVSSFGIGVNGEYVIKKPLTLIGDVKGALLDNGDKDYSASLGLRYYLGDKDWVDVKGVNWRESIRDTNTTMGYVSGHHEFNEKLSGTAYAGVGKEYGAGNETVSEVGAKLSYKLNKKLSVDVGGSHHNSKTKNNTLGIGLTWRF